jgi:hypothetical protein
VGSTPSFVEVLDLELSSLITEEGVWLVAGVFESAFFMVESQD